MNSYILNILNKGVRISALDGSLKLQLGEIQLSDSEINELQKYKNGLLDYIGEAKIARASFSQERLWFLDQLGFGNQYHIPAIGEIKGYLDLMALENSLNWIVSRHESLRTQFRNIDGVAIQYILRDKYANVKLELSNIISETNKEENEKRLIQEFISRPFDLKNDLLFRVLLLKREANDYLLCINMHHIISDGWSIKVLIQDLQFAYSAFSEGRVPNIENLKVHYSGFSAWQRKQLQNHSIIEKELSYWKDQLEDYTDLNFPTDYPRPSRLSGKGDYKSILFSTSLGNKISDFAKEHRTTSFTIFTALVYTLLSKHAQQTDICIGMPVANRNHPDLENLIGFFVNTVILRINPNKECLTQNLIELIHKTISDAQEHQQLPVERILELLKPERDLSKTPIFQTLISYTPFTSSEVVLGDAIIFPKLPESNVSKFDLTFSFTQKEDNSVLLAIEYSSELFRDQTITTFCNQLEILAENFINNPLLPFSRQKLIRDEYEKKVVENSKGLLQELPRKSIHQLFSEQAKITPNKMAVVSTEQSITYEILENRSNLLAYRLIHSGICKGQIVAICMDRSVELIISLYAILKSGATYLPIDSSYPLDRIDFLIRDSDAVGVIYDSTSSFIFDNSFSDLLKIQESNNIEDEQNTIDFPLINADITPAYLMYTSGSTGNPKGVLVTHENVINHNFFVKKAYQITSTDNILQFSSISFDIFVEEVFPALMSGATIVMMDSKEYRDLNYLKKMIEVHSITVLNLPTSYWHALSDENFSHTNIRLLIIGGEKAEYYHYRRWLSNNQNIKVINTYGPTETTVISLWYEINENNLETDIPIGKPIDNTIALVLDEYQQIVPDGLIGELYIGGKGVSKGYWKNDHLTQKCFIKNPFGEGVLYRTGDRVKRRLDGNLIYLGRMDQQVKIRGYRIEPSEVEMVLLSCEGVKDVAVVVQDRGGVKQLVAFYTLENNVFLDEDSIRYHLKKRLPEYMIPVHYKKLSEIPLNINGKKDYKLLMKEEVDSTIRQIFEEPISLIEKELSAIWQELLSIDRISRNDNFFHLGGHSLLAIQTIKKIEKRLGVILPLTVIFENQILADLANWIENNSFINNGVINTLRVLRKEKEREVHIIIPGMPGLVSGYNDLAKSIPGNGMVYGLELPGCFEGEPYKSIEEIALHHYSQIKSLCENAQVHFYAHSFGGTILYELLKLFSSENINVNRVVLIDSFQLLPYHFSDIESKERFCFAFMRFIGINENRFTKVQSILHDSNLIDWENNLTHWMSKILNIDEDIIQRLWKVVKVSLSISYEYDQQLPYRATIIQAAGSYDLSTLGMNHWVNCFSDIKWIDSKGDHFTIVKDPFCIEWLNLVDDHSCQIK
jgi:amino acid adenylation domain-containing protein